MRTYIPDQWLRSWFLGRSPYELNEAAITAHDMNLRTDELGKLFGAVGIGQLCERIRHADALQRWFCSQNEIVNRPKDGVPAMTVQARLDSLAERRNQVTHRGGNPEELLGATEMADMIVPSPTLESHVLRSATHPICRVGPWIPWASKH